MAFTKTNVVSSQGVVMMAFIQWLFRQQYVDDICQQGKIQAQS